MTYLRQWDSTWCRPATRPSSIWKCVKHASLVTKHPRRYIPFDTSHSPSLDPLVQWLARGAVNTGRVYDYKTLRSLVRFQHGSFFLLGPRPDRATFWPLRRLCFLVSVQRNTVLRGERDRDPQTKVFVTYRSGRSSSAHSFRMLDVSLGMQGIRTPGDFDHLPAGEAKVARHGIRLLDARELRLLQAASGQYVAGPKGQRTSAGAARPFRRE